MTKLELAKARNKRLNTQIQELTNNRRDVRDSIAKMNCPFSEGDVLVSNRKERAVVVKISWRGSDMSYQMYGYKLKKDGERYKVGMTLYGSEKWRLENA